MGMYISIFAKESKVRFEVGRSWVIDNLSGTPNEEHKVLWDCATDPNKGLNKNDIKYFIVVCEQLWVGTQVEKGFHADKSRGSIYCLAEMLKFVDKFPNDTFFVLNDVTDVFWEYVDDYLRFEPMVP